MKTRSETSESAVGTSVSADVMSVVRNAVFAGALAIPMALASAADGLESDSEFATAGELWLDVQNKMRVAAERIL
jgi:hypothetical protein